MSAANKAIVRRFYEDVINRRDLVPLDQLLAEEYVEHGSSGGQPSDLEGFRQFLAMVATAFPDLQVAIEDVIADEDKVAVRLTVRGTHRGTLMGTIPATGRTAAWTGIDILRIAGGKIVERWSQRDLVGMLQQLGAIPAPGKAGPG